LTCTDSKWIHHACIHPCTPTRADVNEALRAFDIVLPVRLRTVHRISVDVGQVRAPCSRLSRTWRQLDVAELDPTLRIGFGAELSVRSGRRDGDRRMVDIARLTRNETIPARW